jgi:hypothetical protein
MAQVRTTLTAAFKSGDTQLAVANATGIAAGMYLQIDAEFLQVQSSYVSGLLIPVLPGRNGSLSLAHPLGAGVTAGTAADAADPPAQSAASVNLPANRVREIKSLGAGDTVCPLPRPGCDLFVMLTGAVPILATLANPRKDNDGDMLVVGGAGAAAHTITYATGFGGVVASDVVTFPASPATAGFAAIACNEKWVALGGLVPA